MKNIFITILFISSLVFNLNAEYIRDNDKKIVNDTKSGLMWQDDLAGSEMNWDKAKKTCKNLTLGNYHDWRLPTINKLRGIVDKNRTNPTLSTVFTSFVSDYYWSSSMIHIKDFYWGLDFANGNELNYYKLDESYVRCVRTR